MATNIPKIQNKVIQDLVKAKSLAVGKPFEEATLKRAETLEKAIREGGEYTFTIVKNGQEKKVTLDNRALHVLKNNLMQGEYDQRKAKGLILRIFRSHEGSGKSLDAIEGEIAQALATNNFSLLAENARTGIHLRSAQRKSENLSRVKDEIAQRQSTEIDLANKILETQKTELTDANKMLDKINANNESVEKKIVTADSVLSSRNKTLESLKEEQGKLNKALESAEGQLKTANARRTELQDEIARLEQEATKLNKKMIEAEGQTENALTGSINKNSELYQTAEEQSNGAQVAIGNQVQENETILNGLKSQRVVNEGELQSIRSDIKTLEETKKQNDSLLKEKRAELKDLNDAIMAQKGEIARLGREVNRTNLRTSAALEKNASLANNVSEKTTANETASAIASLF